LRYSCNRDLLRDVIKTETKTATPEQLQSIRDWNAERVARVDAYAATLTHLGAAVSALPYGDSSRGHFVGGIEHVMTEVRGRLRAVLDEPNPYV
jgi:hypothetical protein